MDFNYRNTYVSQLTWDDLIFSNGLTFQSYNKSVPGGTRPSAIFIDATGTGHVRKGSNVYGVEIRQNQILSTPSPVDGYVNPSVATSSGMWMANYYQFYCIPNNSSFGILGVIYGQNRTDNEVSPLNNFCPSATSQIITGW
jgi:hypothetical protein